MSVEQAWRLLTNNYREGEHGAIAAVADSSIIEVLMRTRAIIGAPK